MCDRNCGNCFYCLDDVTLEYEYEKTMKKSLINRINKCNCYMCNDPRSASCIEVDLYINYKCSENMINTRIEEIRTNYKRKKSLFLVYMLCLRRFLNLFQNTIEKRYSPNGNGYIEAFARFEINKKL